MSDREASLYSTLVRVLFVAAGLGLSLWFAYEIGMILLVGVFSLIIAIAVNAPVEWLERRNVPRGLGTAITFLVLLGIGAVVGWLVVPQLFSEIPALIEGVPELIQDVADQAMALVGDSPEIRRQLSRVVDWSLTLFEGLWRHTDALLTMLLMIIVVMALVLYMVTNMREILRWYIRSMPERFRDPATRAFARSSQMVIGWIYASVVIGAIKATAAFVFLSLMAVPAAILWSMLAFFGAFIPRVGFYLMTIPPVIVAFTVGPLVALWTLIFYVTFSELLGNFIAPRIFAETMKINAVLILFMTLALGYAFGLIGVLISAPVTGFIAVYYDEFFLARQAEDPVLDRRIRAMMTRRIE